MNDYYKVLGSYDLGEVKNIEENKIGTTNYNYEVTSERGKFLLQKLSYIYDERYITKYRKLEEVFKGTPVKIPPILPTQSGDFFVKIGSETWRLFEYIEHDKLTTLDKTFIHTAHAEEAGKLLGYIHNILNEKGFLPAAGYFRPDYNDTEYIFSKLEKLIDKYPEKAQNPKAQEFYKFIVDEINKIDIPTYNGNQTIHADPAIRNFLFKDGKVVAVVDWDDYMRGNQLRKLGEALQSWALEKPNIFHKELFDAGYEGFHQTSKIKYSYEDAVEAAKHYILQISARYLSYYFENEYFKHWKSNDEEKASLESLSKCEDRVGYYRNFCKVMN